MKSFIRVAIFALMFPLASQAQTVDIILLQGDQYFDNNQYINAIRFYKSALDQEPGHVAAQYKIASCYRLTFDYEMAEFYYGSVLKTGDIRFLLSGYYYAIMKKLNGDYSAALLEFDAFLQLIKKDRQHESDEYRHYYKQAKIENEGCQMALNQLTEPKPDHKFKVLPSPVNTEANDYAAGIYQHDSLIAITSARKAGKGSLVDNTYGEAFTDIFRFHLEKGSWKAFNVNDRFSGSVNTKWGDGAGSFNADRDEFFYTNCHEELESVCQIYVTELVNGKWTESVPLNANINYPGFTSKHPNVTPSGDTLLWVSDRPGGSGDLDIWMSLTAGGQNWGPAINLGNQINTPFRETSPFYDRKENALFFSSDGHRGFGGHDLYMAKGQTFELSEIYNIGTPYNSNKDEIFIALGEKHGYLSSNRDGGIGKLDIYQFNIITDKEIVVELTNEDLIAGRNSLFSDDYEFDEENVDRVNEIISARVASSMSDINMVLTDDQMALYNGLSKDDKEKIERIVKARIRNLTENSLRALRVEDEFYYSNLSAEERKRVDNMVYNYLQEDDLAMSISFDHAEKEFYSMLSADEKSKVDQIIAHRVSRGREYKYEPKVYNSLAKNEKTNVDQIASSYFKEKKSIEHLQLSVNNNFFLKQLNDDDRKKINTSIKEKILTLDTDKSYELKDEDRIFYQNLNTNQLNGLENLANSFIVADVTQLEASMGASSMIYNQFNSAQRVQLDRILAKMISNTVRSDIYFAEANLVKNDFEGVDLQKELDEAYKELESNKQSLFAELDDVDKQKVKRFLTVAEDWLSKSKPVFFPETAETPSEIFISADASQAIQEETKEEVTQPPVEVVATEEVEEEKPVEIQPSLPRVVEAPPPKIEQSDVDYYMALSENGQKSIDRIIAMEYITRADQDKRLKSADEAYYNTLSREQRGHIEMLAKNMNGESFTPPERDMLMQALTLYGNFAIGTKQKWNRLVIRNALDNVNGKYRVTKQDASFKLKMTPEDQKYASNIQQFRFANHRIISENMPAEALDLPDRSTVLNVPTYANQRYMYISFTGQLFDVSSGEPLSDYPLSAIDAKDNVISKTFTSKNGEFEFKELPADDYRIISKKDNAANLIEDKFFVKNLNVTGTGERTEGFEVRTNLYFDFASKDLRGESKVTLDEIAELSKKQGIKIELKSYTDNIGADDYNLKLSEQRNESVKNYLVAKSVQEGTLTYRSFGLKDPVAKNDNIYGRQFNRRIEVIIRSEQDVDYEPLNIYLVKPKATLYSIAKNFNVKKEEIQRLNGLKSDKLEAYKPIRIPNPRGYKPDLALLVELDPSIVHTITYIVKRYDTLEKIANKFNLPEELIAEMNNKTTVSTGDKLQIYIRN